MSEIDGEFMPSQVLSLLWTAVYLSPCPDFCLAGRKISSGETLSAVPDPPTMQGNVLFQLPHYTDAIDLFHARWTVDVSTKLP
jgi:hypothetical protein